MDTRFKLSQPIHPVRNTKPDQNIGKNTSKSNRVFKDVLNKNLLDKTVKFSKHAQDRLISRDIKLSDKELKQLASGVKKAEEKGSKDSLILLNNIAYVVSVENKTVVTAVDNNSMDEKVFTNIDSAVFMD